MLAVLSPSKTMDFSAFPASEYSTPEFLDETNHLAKLLKEYSPKDLQRLMKMSDKLAMDTRDKYSHFRYTHDPDHAKPAIFTYTGDVFKGLNSADWEWADVKFAQKHLLVLSGFYGVLKPLDLIQPYRLEVGASFSFESYANLYEYWSEKVTQYLISRLAADKEPVLLNLASDEYFSMLNEEAFKARMLTVKFKEYRNGQLKFITFFAKKARGLFARYLVRERISDLEDLKGFHYEGYSYAEDLSTEDEWLFIR